MLPNLVTYITYADVYKDIPPTVEEIQDFFRKYHTGHLIQGLCKLNIALWKGERDGKIHAALAGIYFSKEELKSIHKVLKEKSRMYPFIFHRQQALFAIKLALLNVNAEGIREIDLKKIGKYLLAISYHFENNQKPPLISFVRSDFEFTRKALAQLSYFSHYGIFMNNYARAIDMWLNIPFTDRGKELLSQFKIDPHTDFYKETGLTIEEYISFGLMNLYQVQQVDLYTENPNDYMIFSNFFSSTKLKGKKIESLYKLVSQDINEYKANNELFVKTKLNGVDQFEKNFLPNIDYPILRINDNMAIVSDPRYLEERITYGVYWILLNKYIKEGDKEKAQLLSSYYGMLHQEYMYNSLLNVCDTVHEIKKSETDMLADFIGVINRENKIYLLVIESKKIALSLPLVLNSEKDKTIKELKKIFLDKGFRQIFNTIKIIQEGKSKDYELPEFDLSKVEVIFPILATDRFIAEESLNRKFYEENFFDPLARKFRLNRFPQVANPMFISSEEFDRIESFINDCDKTELIKILAIRHNELNKRYNIPENKQIIPGMTFEGIIDAIQPLENFWNFLYTVKSGKHTNNRLKKIFDKQMEISKKLLF